MNKFVICFNSKKPVAEVKPTKSVMQPPAPKVERRRSVGTNLKKRSSEMGPNFTPFNEPQRALHLVSTQINSPEWYVPIVMELTEMYNHKFGR